MLHRGARPKLPLTMLGALGVVFGDIGTSPLYAVSTLFYSRQGLPISPDSVIGCISCILWALLLIIAIKYVTFVLRADLDGEGGVFALYGLLHEIKRPFIGGVLWMLIVAAGLLIGDGVITPAISVLSATEGLKLVHPFFEPYLLQITVLILTGLFAIQFAGSSRVGALFGPIMAIWFATIAVNGLRLTLDHPEILAALDPRRGFFFLLESPFSTRFLVLSCVILVLTGGEALYADLGHFGAKAIRQAYFTVVLPSLVLCYLGQGAFLLSGQTVNANNVFFSSLPSSFVLPIVILAAAATVVASQALISGAFSIASQAVALGLLPRMEVVHTHKDHHGQTYSPLVNWLLFGGCVTLVLTFKSSTALASAYGLAEAGVMVSTSVSMLLISNLRWGWSWRRSALVFGAFAAIDMLFLIAKSLQILDGGYISISIALVLSFVMMSWRWGRKATFAAYNQIKTMSLSELIAIKEKAENQIDKNVVLLVPKPIFSLDEPTPALLQLFWERYQVLPRDLIFVEVLHLKVPYVHEDRYEVRILQKQQGRGSLMSVGVRFGFMEEPNIERSLEKLARHHMLDLSPDPRDWLVHASVERVMFTGGSLFQRFRLRVFLLLRQISTPGYYFYGLGDQVNLSVEILPVKI